MIWLLLVLYQVKHFVCDYPLQGKYMLGKFKPYPDFILPLAAHALVHVLGTFLIAVFLVGPTMAVALGLLDGVIHFAVDRVKASPSMLGRFKPLTKETYPTSTDAEKKSNVLFWWSIGADQMVHHLTHYALIALIIEATK